MNLNRKFLAAKYKNLKYLTEITLRSNQIKSIDNETFNDLDNLICVNISSNQIEKINNGIFNCLVKLTIISLSSNKINEIGLKTVVQLLADKDLRGAEILLKHMVL